MELTKREKYNLNFFFPKYLSEKDAIEVVKKISEIGSNVGFIGNQGNDSRREHKYDTWIAKVVKDELEQQRKANKPLNTNILNNEIEFRNILDWMISEKIDAFKYTYKQAFIEQELWHEKIAMQMKISSINIPELDPSRIIYRCKDQEYFFYILTPEELRYEGVNMGHCVGGTSYQNKVKNDKAIIVSLRDKNNKPHITTEILLQKDSQLNILGMVSQCQGKGNNNSWKPAPKYLEKIQEFVLFASNYYDDEILNFMNKKYIQN
jgi:hypothetical protein